MIPVAYCYARIGKADCDDKNLEAQRYEFDGNLSSSALTRWASSPAMRIIINRTIANAPGIQ